VRAEAVEAQDRVALFEDADAFQRGEFFGEFEFSSVFGDDDGVGVYEGSVAEEIHNAEIFLGGRVRGIEEHEIVREIAVFLALFQLFEGAMGIHLQDGGAFADLQGFEIIADEFRGGGVIFYEEDVFGAAAQGFNADGAGAGEKIEEAGARDSGGENVEKGFAEPVAGGAEVGGVEGFELARAVQAGDDAHERLDSWRAEIGSYFTMDSGCGGVVLLQLKPVVASRECSGLKRRRARRGAEVCVL
jgi:hypothetical protein